MLKKLFFIYFILFKLCLLQAQQKITNIEDVEWKNITGKEIVLFVGNTTKTQKKFDGSKKAPFKTIEDAFTYLSGAKKKLKTIKALIYIKGSFKAKNVYIITIPTKIVGLDNPAVKDATSNINFEKNAGFVVTSSHLFIEKCSISRKEFIDEPRSVPVLYSSNSLVKMKNITITAKEGGTLFRFIESNAQIEASILNSNQNGYCNMIEAIKSDVAIKDTTFNCKGRFVVAIDSSNSFLNIEAIQCNILAHLFAIALKANDGEINIQNSTLIAEGKYIQADEAITHNKKAKINIKDIKLKGFVKETKES
ncbi:MAG: hypothetical protein ACTTKH_03465 [Treponema sp.]